MILPKWYYYRAGESDRTFIETRMRHIPADIQSEVCEKYESLYMQNGHIHVKDGRKEANTYLHELARKYQRERSPDALQRHHDEMERLSSESKSKTAKRGAQMPSTSEGKIFKDTWG